MKSIHYLIKSNTDATASPLLVVPVGTSKREQSAHAQLAALALVDNTIYYCRKDDESQSFIARLLEQNPEREIYRVSPSVALRFVENGAIAGNVKNLSFRYRLNAQRTASRTHSNFKL